MAQDLIEELLTKAGLKHTRPRERILSLLIEGNVHLTAEQIYFALKAKEENLGLATVYRTLTAMEQSGILASVEIDGRQSYYYSSGGHQHVLLCTGCGKIIMLHQCPAESLIRSVEKDFGFLVTGHKFELVGLCPECRKQKGL